MKQDWKSALWVAIIASVIGSASAWFTLARSLVTRSEVEQMIQARVELVATNYTRQEQLIEDMRDELIALRGEVIRLGVLLSVERARDRAALAGEHDTKGS